MDALLSGQPAHRSGGPGGHSAAGVPPGARRHQCGGRVRPSDPRCAAGRVRVAVRSRRRKLLWWHCASLGGGRPHGVPTRRRGHRRLRRIAELLGDQKLRVGDQARLVDRPDRPDHDPDSTRLPHGPSGPSWSGGGRDAWRRARSASTGGRGGTLPALDRDALRAVKWRYQGSRESAPGLHSGQ